jgi:hypothetical protein
MRENFFKIRARTDEEYKILKEISHISFQSNKASYKTNGREVNTYQSSSLMCGESQDMEKDCICDGDLAIGNESDTIESKSKCYTPHSKGRKRKCVGPSRFPWDEEAQAFDADVDESSRSSIEQKLHTTFQSGTTLTWTSSSASSSTKPSRKTVSRLTLTTPPRLRQGLDISSCSELSPLSCDGTTVGLINSSLSCSSESRDNCSPAEWYQVKRKRYPVRRTNLHRVSSSVRKPVESVSLIVDEGVSKRHNADVVKKKSYLILRTKYLLWKLLFVIVLYATFSFHKVFEMITCNHIFNTNELAFSSENIVLSKGDKRRQNDDHGIQIQQSVGGLHLIHDTPRRVEELGEIKKGFWGLGEIDVTFYGNSTRLLSTHDTSIAKPRVMFLNGVTDSSKHRKTLFEMDSTPFSDNTQLYGVLSSDDEALSKMEVLLPNEDGECISEPWQKEYYPSCNNVHEFDFIHVDDQSNGAHLGLFEKQGYWRNAWRADVLLSDKDHEKETFIIKTPK